ncbi:hypothetical protein AQUCO_02600013v1, partial [Aquilegia coerulea]
MEGEDRISFLPDELIIHILSFLNMNHAVSTSVLSKSWRYLWTFNPRMCFDFETFQPQLCNFASKETANTYIRVNPYIRNFASNRNNYVAVIDHCIQQYQAKKLQTLSIRLDVSNEDALLEMKTWLDFAIDKKVEDLKLYNISELFSLSDIKCFDSLKSLCLRDVEAFDGAIETLLSKCTCLQKLDLAISIKPNWNKLYISLPELQHLSIHFIRYHSLEIYAPNLLSLK